MISKSPHSIIYPAPQFMAIPFRSSGRNPVYSIPTTAGTIKSIKNKIMILIIISVSYQVCITFIIITNMILNYSSAVNLSLSYHKVKGLLHQKNNATTPTLINLIIPIHFINSSFFIAWNQFFPGFYAYNP